MSRKFILMGIISISCTAMLVVGYFFFAGKPAFYGLALQPPRQAAEIDVKDMNGNVFRTNDLRGKVLLLYFGYVNCPLECPLTMAHLKQALGLLGSDSQDVKSSHDQHRSATGYPPGHA